MISWFWAPVCVLIGIGAGFLLAALMAANEEDDRRNGTGWYDGR